MNGRLQMTIDDWFKVHGVDDEDAGRLADQLLPELLELLDAQEVELRGWRESAVLESDETVRLRRTPFVEELIKTMAWVGPW